MSGMTNQEIEQAIQAKGLTAPRVTSASIAAKITGEQFHQFPGTTLTVCCLTLENGYTVVGQSAAASPQNFDAELGRSIAKADALDKIWALEGYLLREKLHAPDLRALLDAATTAGDAAAERFWNGYAASIESEVPYADLAEWKRDAISDGLRALFGELREQAGFPVLSAGGGE